MKPLFLILILAFTAQAQTPQDWKFIKEMSGEIPDHPGLTVNWYAAEIARGNNIVKLLLRFDMPGGAPADLFKGAASPGFDISSITRVEAKIEFNCDTLVVKPVSGSSDVYQFNGKKLKSKEPPFVVGSEHIFSQYFCERGDAPKVAPTLKPK
jgi:hypothetical protein